jgi:hypothetical protein
MVEPVFSQLRGRQGLNRFRRKGLAGVKVEFALHAMAYNLGRALVLAFFSALYQWLRRMAGEFERMSDFWHLSVTHHGFRLAEENRAGF